MSIIPEALQRLWCFGGTSESCWDSRTLFLTTVLYVEGGSTSRRACAISRDDSEELCKESRRGSDSDITSRLSEQDYNVSSGFSQERVTSRLTKVSAKRDHFIFEIDRSCAIVLYKLAYMR